MRKISMAVLNCDQFAGFWNYCTIAVPELEISLEYP